jgi:hypothetical protein
MWKMETFILCVWEISPRRSSWIQAVIFLRPHHSYVDIRQGKLGFAGSQDGCVAVLN